jgi:hypothetical protein
MPRAVSKRSDKSGLPPRSLVDLGEVRAEIELAAGR